MGRAVIHSSLGAGRYWVDIKYNTKLSDAMKARLTSRISDLEMLISTCEAAIAVEESNLLNANNTSPPSEWKVIFAIKTRLNEYKRKRWRAVLEKESHTQKIASLDLLIGTIRREAWCADRTTDLTGEVGTIEPHGVQAETPILQPGYGGNAEYDGDRDGCLQHAQATVPEATFWNLAMLPGWQKWVPIYRTGTILTLDKTKDTATVSLDTAVSTQHPVGQDIDLNVEEILQDIPVDYMNCNAEAFAVGDHVVVWFEDQEWAKAKVIGFVDNPKPCTEYAVFRTRIWTGGGAVVETAVVWDINGNKAYEDGGFTSPCDASSPEYVAWLETIEDVGVELHDAEQASERNSSNLVTTTPDPGDTDVTTLPSALPLLLPDAIDHSRQTREDQYSGETLIWSRLFIHTHINAWGNRFDAYAGSISSGYGMRQQTYDEGDSPIPPPEFQFILIQNRINYETHSLEGVRQEFDDTFYVNGEADGEVDTPISYSDCYRDLSMGDDLWGYDTIEIAPNPALPVIERIGIIRHKFSGYANEPMTYFGNDDPDDTTKDDPEPYGGSTLAKFVFDYSSRDYQNTTYPAQIGGGGLKSARSIFMLNMVIYVPKLTTKRKYHAIASPFNPIAFTTPYYNISEAYEDRVVVAAAYVASGTDANRMPLPTQINETLSQLIVDAYEMAYTLAGFPKNMTSTVAYTSSHIYRKK